MGSSPLPQRGRGRQGVLLTLLLLLQDMEISVFELRTILNRVIARRECCPLSPLRSPLPGPVKQAVF